jgi:hypothetical protein
VPASRRRLAASLLPLALAAGCGGPKAGVRPGQPPAAPRTATGPLPPEPPPGLVAALPEPTRARLVGRAAAWVGHRGAFAAGGRRFPADCSGFVEAVYESSGIPIRDAVAIRAEDGGSAAMALRREVQALGVLYGAEREPLPGDLVFFADTYDRNRNGRTDDGITHAGLVTAILPDGTVEFLHRGSRGVARARLHLGTPDLARTRDGAARNSALRAAGRGDPGGTPTLAGQLFAGFGRIDAARVAAVLEGNDRLDLGVLGLAE